MKGEVRSLPLRVVAARGALWTAAAQVGGQLVMLGVNVILARLLTPAEFGTAGVALVAALILSAVTQMGLGAAVVQRPRLEQRHYDTALWMSVGAGVGLGAAFLASAGPLAALLRNVALVPVLRLYSVFFVLGGLASVQAAMLTREFRFRELALVGLAARLAGAAVSVGLALRGMGVMAIAWGYAALNGVNAALLVFLSGRFARPGRQVSLTALGELFGFGSGIMGMNLLNQLANGLDVLVVGRVMGPSSTGFYSVANQLVTYVPGRLGATLSTVAFPAMARVQEDRTRLGEAYLKLTGFTALVVLPLLAGTAVLARDLVPVLFSTKWNEAAVLVPALSVYGAVVAFDWVWTQTLKALGRSWSIALVVALRVIGLVVAVLVGARWGLGGVAWSVAGFGLVYWFAYQSVVCRALKLGLAGYCRVLVRPLAGSLVMALAMAAARGSLVAATIVGGAVYGLTAALFNRPVLRELVAMWRSMRGHDSPSCPHTVRIAMMTSVHAWNDVRIYEKEAQSLARHGHDVSVIGPAGDAAHRPAGDAPTGSRVRHVPVRMPPGRLARMTTGALTMLGAALRHQARVFHLHDPELLPVGLALKALGRQVVYDVHEDYPEQILSKHYLPGWLRLAVARAFGRGEKLTARCLDGVVAATDNIAGKFAGARVVTVRNYPKTVAVRRRHSAGAERPFRICHLAGTLTEERGVTSLVRAMEHLGEGFELVLAGRFVPFGYEQELRGMAGFRRVRYLGVVPHEEVWHWYGQSDVGAVCLLPVPRFRVSLPVKLFEFMSAGLPVVASDFPLFRQIVEGSDCGICVNPDQPEAIAEALRRLAADDAQRDRMGANGSAAVKSGYQWESEAETLIRFYHGVVQ